MSSQYLLRGKHLPLLHRCCKMHEWLESFSKCYHLAGVGFTSSMTGINGGRLRGLRNRGLIVPVDGTMNPYRYVASPESLAWYHRGEQA